MTRRKQILVIGFGKDHCPESSYRAAYEVGHQIAQQNAVLITGGLGGVMEAASRGAKEAGGFVVGIIPQDDKSKANEYCDVVVATGMGYARDFVTAYSADAVIVVGGGAGTMIEIAAAYQKKIPIVALKGTGGAADQLADSFLDDRELERIVGESSATGAAAKALSLAT